jgi:hypothetical protein
MSRPWVYLMGLTLSLGLIPAGTARAELVGW